MMEKALLVTVMLADRSDGWSAQDSSRELAELAGSSGTEVAGEMILTLKSPQPRMYVGPGQADEIRRKAEAAEADTVILSHDISGTQQRNLEELIGRKTIDRTQLILDIFARRARSNEGKIQVELAQLTYLMPRLAGQGILLSRQGGGIGTRGPGEQKIETDRRRLRDRIVFLKNELVRMQERRQSYRDRRREHELPVAALVGYTNAGKSTLFNALTDSEVIARNQLFSTLDSTVRGMNFPNAPKAMLVDTVGFLHLLPHHLIDAFKATLEEVTDADVLLHVIDVSDPKAHLMERSVRGILDEMRVSKKPVIAVLNKSDRVSGSDRKSLEGLWADGVWVSAVEKTGFEELARSLHRAFRPQRREYRYAIPAGEAKLIHEIYQQGEVIARKDEGALVRLRAVLSPAVGESVRARLRSLGTLK